VAQVLRAAQGVAALSAAASAERWRCAVTIQGTAPTTENLCQIPCVDDAISVEVGVARLRGIARPPVGEQPSEVFGIDPRLAIDVAIAERVAPGRSPTRRG
jgi:hypothetical protein